MAIKGNRGDLPKTAIEVYQDSLFKTAEKFIEYIAKEKLADAKKECENLQKTYRQALEVKEVSAEYARSLRWGGNQKEQIQEKLAHIEAHIKDWVLSAVMTQVYHSIYNKGKYVGWKSSIDILDLGFAKTFYEAVKAEDVSRLQEIIQLLQKVIDYFNDNKKVLFFMEGIDCFPPVKDFLNERENVTEFILPQWHGLKEGPYFCWEGMYKKNILKSAKYLCSQGYDPMIRLWIGIYEGRFEEGYASLGNSLAGYVKQIYEVCCAIKFDFNEERKGQFLKLLILKMNENFSEEGLEDNYFEWRELFIEIVKEWGLPIFATDLDKFNMKRSEVGFNLPIEFDPEFLKELKLEIKALRQEAQEEAKRESVKLCLEGILNPDLIRIIQEYSVPVIVISPAPYLAVLAVRQNPAKKMESKDDLNTSVQALKEMKGAGSPVNAGSQSATTNPLSLDAEQLVESDAQQTHSSNGNGVGGGFVRRPSQ